MNKIDWPLTLFTIAAGIGFVYAWVQFWYFQEITMENLEFVQSCLITAFMETKDKNNAIEYRKAWSIINQLNELLEDKDELPTMV